MAKLYFKSFSHKDQDQMASNGNYITSVRDGFETKDYSNTSSKYASADYPGLANKKCSSVGGSGKSGGHYHNITYLSLYTISQSDVPAFSTISDIPSSIKINSVTLTLVIYKADPGNLKKCTWKINPCSKLTNKLTGKNKPTVYTSASCTSKQDINAAADDGVHSIEVTIDIKETFKYLLNNNLNCLQLDTSYETNRRNLLPYALVEVDFDYKPTLSKSSITTDCVGDSYVQNTISYSASGTGSYYRYIHERLNDSGKVIKTVSSGWITDKTYSNKTTLPEGTKMRETIQHAFSKTEDENCIASFTKDLTQNISPSYTFPTLENFNNCVYSNNKYIATGSLSLSISNVQYYGIKKNWNGDKITWKDDGTAKNHTTSQSYSLTAKDSEYIKTIAVDVTNGWLTTTTTKKVTAAKKLTKKVAGKLSEDKCLCNSDAAYNVEISQTTGLSVKSNGHQVTFKGTNTKTESINNGLTTTTSTLTNKTTISLSNYYYVDNKPSIKITGSFTNNIGQSLTWSHTCYINRRPRFKGVKNNNVATIYDDLSPKIFDVSRTSLDIFGHHTFSEDYAMGYNFFTAPALGTYTNNTFTISSIDKFKVSVQGIQDADGDANLQLSVKAKRVGSSGGHEFDEKISGTEFLKTQTQSNIGQSTITVGAWDDYNYGYDNTHPTKSFTLLTSGGPSKPGNYYVKSYLLKPSTSTADADYTDEGGTEYITYNSSAQSSYITCGTYVRIFVPLANSGATPKIPNTLEDHVRIKVYVYQGTTQKYNYISDAAISPITLTNEQIDSTTTLNGRYHEIFFPLGLHQVNNQYVTFKVCYVDRFNNESALLTNAINYQPFEYPVFDVCGTKGGGFRWLLINPRYKLDGDEDESKFPITDENFLRDPLFYSIVKNQNMESYKITARLYKDNGSTLVSTYSTQFTIAAAKVNSVKNTVCAFHFGRLYDLDTEYNVILSLYQQDDTMIAQTPFNLDSTFSMSYNYRRSRSSDTKAWNIEDFLPENIVSAEHVNIINDYIRKVWTAYRCEGDLPLLDVEPDTIITGNVGTQTYDIIKGIPRDEQFYYPDLDESNNRCGTEVTGTAVTGGYYSQLTTKYIDIDDRRNSNQDLQVQVPIHISASTAKGKQVGINIDFYNNELEPIFTDQVIDQDLTIPSTYNTNSTIPNTADINFNEVYDKNVVCNSIYKVTVTNGSALIGRNYVYGLYGTTITMPEPDYGEPDKYLAFYGKQYTGANDEYIDYGRAYMYEDKISIHARANMTDWSQFYLSRIISCAEGGGWNIETYSQGGPIKLAIYDAVNGYDVSPERPDGMKFSDLSSGAHNFDIVFDGSYGVLYVDDVEVYRTERFANAPNGRIKYHNTNSILVGTEAGTAGPDTTYNFVGYIGNVVIKHTDQKLDAFNTEITVPKQDITVAAYSRPTPYDDRVSVPNYLTSNTLLDKVKYIKLSIDNKGNNEVVINPNKLYVSNIVSGIYNSYEDYVEIPDYRKVTVNLDDDGHPTKTSFINVVLQNMVILRDEIYNTVGDAVTPSAQHSPRNSVFATDTDANPSYIVSYDYPVKDLTGTTWHFNDTVNVYGNIYPSFNFTDAVGNEYIMIQDIGALAYVPANDEPVVVYSIANHWQSEDYRTITITGGSDPGSTTNATYIAWLYANAELRDAPIAQLPGTGDIDAIAIDGLTHGGVFDIFKDF